MRLSPLLVALAGVFAESANNYKHSDRKFITNKNHHNFQKFEIAGIVIYAVNEASANAQFSRLMEKKEMRLKKSLAKENK